MLQTKHSTGSIRGSLAALDITDARIKQVTKSIYEDIPIAYNPNFEGVTQRNLKRETKKKKRKRTEESTRVI